MSRNVWNRPSGSFMVDMVISSNIMKSPSPKCYITFWDMAIYSDTLNWSDITPICEPNTELDLITDLIYYQISGGFHRTLERVWLANRGCLLLRNLVLSHLGLAFVLMLRPFFPEFVMSTDLFEFRTSLGTSILLDTCCNVMVLLICIPLSCKTLNHLSSPSPRGRTVLGADFPVVDWRSVGSNPAGDIYFDFEFFAPSSFQTGQRSHCKWNQEWPFTWSHSCFRPQIRLIIHGFAYLSLQYSFKLFWGNLFCTQIHDYSETRNCWRQYGRISKRQHSVFPCDIRPLLVTKQLSDTSSYRTP